MIRVRISDPRPLGSWCSQETARSTLEKDSAVSLIHHDPSELDNRSLAKRAEREKQREKRVERANGALKPREKGTSVKISHVAERTEFKLDELNSDREGTVFSTPNQHNFCSCQYLHLLYVY